MDYKCSICGEIHNDFPAIGYSAPDDYQNLTEEEKQNFKAHIDSDFCVIEFPAQTAYYVRVVLFQKINDSDIDLQYGFWVSLSQKSYEDYLLNFDNDNHETQYFGWLCNDIPDYVFDEHIPTTVVTQNGNNRPIIFPHKDFEHPFVKDFYNGIDLKEASKRVHRILNKF